MPNPPALPSVYIVDDDEALRESLEFLFASRGVTSRSWPSGEGFLAAYQAEWPGCILIDIRMNGMSGLELFDALIARGAVQPIIFLTGHGEVPTAVDALKRGAVDFVEKPFQDNNLVDRVLAALTLADKRHHQARSETEFKTRLNSLSPRERDVMLAMIQGKLNKQIADDLGVTMRTVEVHRARVLEKMAARNAVDLARLSVGKV